MTCCYDMRMLHVCGYVNTIPLSSIAGTCTKINLHTHAHTRAHTHIHTHTRTHTHTYTHSSPAQHPPPPLPLTLPAIDSLYQTPSMIPLTLAQRVLPLLLIAAHLATVKCLDSQLPKYCTSSLPLTLALQWLANCTVLMMSFRRFWSTNIPLCPKSSMSV